MPEASRHHKGPVQDPTHAAHLRHPAEADRHAKAAEFHKANGDEAEHARSKNLEKWTRERQVHNLKAKAFVDTLGLSHNVTPTTVTYNDALNYVSKALHEMQHAAEGNPESAKSEYERSHRHLLGVNQGGTPEQHARADEFRALFKDAPEPVKAYAETVAAGLIQEHPHCDPAQLGQPRDHAAEVVAHLGLTDGARIAAAKALFAS